MAVLCACGSGSAGPAGADDPGVLPDPGPADVTQATEAVADAIDAAAEAIDSAADPAPEALPLWTDLAGTGPAFGSRSPAAPPIMIIKMSAPERP